MKIVNIALLMFIGFTLTACVTHGPKEYKKEKIDVDESLGNYEKALLFESEKMSTEPNAVTYLKGDYEPYMKYLTNAVAEEDPRAYLKLFNIYYLGLKNNNYNTLIDSRRYEDAYNYAVLAMENKTAPLIACKTIKLMNDRYIYFDKFRNELPYKIYINNENQKCENIENKDFDFKFTPLKTYLRSLPKKEKNNKKSIALKKEKLKKYAQDAIDGKLNKTFIRHDNRWLTLSQYARDIAVHSSEKDKDLFYKNMDLSVTIANAMPYNKNYKNHTSVRAEKVTETLYETAILYPSKSKVWNYKYNDELKLKEHKLLLDMYTQSFWNTSKNFQKNNRQKYTYLICRGGFSYKSGFYVHLPGVNKKTVSNFCNADFSTLSSKKQNNMNYFKGLVTTLKIIEEDRSLDVEIKKDKYQMMAAKHLKNTNYTKAFPYLEALMRLEKDSKQIKNHSTTVFYYAKTLHKIGKNYSAKRALNRYFKETGTKGRFYKDALILSDNLNQ